MADSYQSALEILTGQKVDLLVTDFNLRANNGIELIKNVPQLNSGIIAVIVSGDSDLKKRENEVKKEAKIREIFLKGFSPAYFVDELERIIREASSVGGENKIFTSSPTDSENTNLNNSLELSSGLRCMRPLRDFQGSRYLSVAGREAGSSPFSRGIPFHPRGRMSISSSLAAKEIKELEKFSISSEDLRQALNIWPYILVGAGIAMSASYLYPLLGLIGYAIVGSIALIPALLVAQLVMVKRMEAFIKTSPIRAGPRPLWFEEITGIIHMHPLVRLHYWNQDASLRLLMQFLLLPHEFIHYLHRLIYANKENWVQEWHHRLIYQFGAFLPLNIIFGLILFIPAFTRPKLFAREEGKRGQTPFSLEGMRMTLRGWPPKR